MQELLAAIRQVKKERQEAIQAKLIWVAALTGMAGALTGLVSVCYR